MTAWVFLDQDGRVTGGREYPPERQKEVPEGAMPLPEGTSLAAMVGRRWTGADWIHDPLPDLEPEPPEVLAAGALQRLRSTGIAELVAWLDAAAAEVTGRVPAAEKLTYDAKEAAALRIQGGEATPADLSLIAIEAALVGEDPAVTVQKILTNAQLFRIVGPLISGLRRRGQVAIAQAATEADIVAATATAQTLYAAALADPQAFAADPEGWLVANV